MDVSCQVSVLALCAFTGDAALQLVWMVGVEQAARCWCSFPLTMVASNLSCISESFTSILHLSKFFKPLPDSWVFSVQLTKNF